MPPLSCGSCPFFAETGAFPVLVGRCVHPGNPKADTMTDEMAACVVTPAPLGHLAGQLGQAGQGDLITTDACGVLSLTTAQGDLLALRYPSGGIMLTSRAYTPAELREIASWGEGA